MNASLPPTGDVPAFDAEACASVLTPDDFAKVGVSNARIPTLRTSEPRSAHLVYAGKSGATGGIELDLYDCDDPETLVANATGGRSVSGRPVLGLPAEESLLATGLDNGRGGTYAAIVVRKGRLVFCISLPDSPRAEAQLSALARIVLERTQSQSWPVPPRHLQHPSASQPAAFRRAQDKPGCAVTAFRLFLIPFVVVGIGILLAVPVAAYVKYLGTPVTADVDRRVFVPGDPDREPAYRIYFHFTLGDTRYDKSNFASEDENAQVSNTVSGRAAQAFGFALFLTPRGFASVNLLLLTGFALGWNLPIYVLLHVLWIAPVRARSRTIRQQLR